MTQPTKTVKSQRIDERHTLVINGTEYRVIATEHTSGETSQPIIIHTAPNGVFRYWYDEDVEIVPLPPRRAPRTVHNPIL